MFTIDVKFLGEKPPRESYSKMTIDEIYNYLGWEACLTITYNHQMLFLEDIAIVEFYWYIVNWYRKFLMGHKEQFIYATVEHTEPILVFLPQQNYIWKLDSIWRLHNKPVLVKEEQLVYEVQKFLKRIMLEIE